MKKLITSLALVLFMGASVRGDEPWYIKDSRIHGRLDAIKRIKRSMGTYKNYMLSVSPLERESRRWAILSKPKAPKAKPAPKKLSYRMVDGKLVKK